MAYNDNKNPFYTDERDDLFATRSGTSGSDMGAPRDPFMDDRPLSRYEQLQQMKENSMNRQTESTQRALASIYDSESMGVSTAEELLQQGEQLDNTESKLDKINQDMKTSQKHLNSIKSVFGGIKTWWQGKDKLTDEASQPQRTQSQPSERLTGALDTSISSGARSGPHPALQLQSDTGRGFYDEDDELDSEFLGAGARRYDQPQSRPAAPAATSARTTQQSLGGQSSQRGGQSSMDAADDQFYKNLDMMSEGMSRLKGLASGLGDEIGRQNEQVDRIQGKADRSDIKIKDQNRQMRKILK